MNQPGTTSKIAGLGLPPHSVELSDVPVGRRLSNMCSLGWNGVHTPLDGDHGS